MGRGCPVFSMKWVMLPSRSIPTLGIKDVVRYVDWDVGMIMRRSYFDAQPVIIIIIVFLKAKTLDFVFV